jgi:hypothetical protein
MIRTLFSLTILAAAALLAVGLNPALRAGDAPPASQPGAVVVARFLYSGGQEAACFAEGFLTDVDRQSTVRVQRHLAPVELSGGDLYRYPLAVMTGDKTLRLSADEKQAFKAYLSRGGFVLASASCSETAWADGFRALLAELFPNQKLTALPMTHPIFHRLYDIDRLVARKGSGQPVIYGLEIEGHLALVFSPLGLNDTANAGPGCCCCGGNELRNAALVNANIVIYTLTR